jgi:hypothetical protein
MPGSGFALAAAWSRANQSHNLDDFCLWNPTLVHAG